MKNPEKLIEKKVRGFKFEDTKYCSYAKEMDMYIGKIGIIDKILAYEFRVNFGEDYYYYPADQIEAHLVEDEIPTLSDGVMMLVGNSLDKLKARKVMFTKNNRYYAFFSDSEILLNGYKYAKPIEPTKEEQLTKILGSSEKVSEIMELFKNE
jgi:hypothetical protein